MCGRVGGWVDWPLVTSVCVCVYIHMCACKNDASERGCNDGEHRSCVCAHAHVCRVYICTRTHTHTHTHKHARTYTRAHVHTHFHTPTRTHTRVYTHTYTRTPPHTLATHNLHRILFATMLIYYQCCHTMMVTHALSLTRTRTHTHTNPTTRAHANAHAHTYTVMAHRRELDGCNLKFATNIKYTSTCTHT